MGTAYKYVILLINKYLFKARRASLHDLMCISPTRFMCVSSSSVSTQSYEVPLPLTFLKKTTGGSERSQTTSKHNNGRLFWIPNPMFETIKPNRRELTISNSVIRNNERPTSLAMLSKLLLLLPMCKAVSLPQPVPQQVPQPVPRSPRGPGMPRGAKGNLGAVVLQDA